MLIINQLKFLEDLKEKDFEEFATDRTCGSQDLQKKVVSKLLLG